MRTNQKIFAPAEVVPASILAPLDLAEIFGRRAPLEVDLGCGDGAFLTALAARHPDRNFLGVERLGGRWRGTSRKIGERQLTNARILRSDILHAVQQLLPPESVTVFHLLFPDPWPKRRHQVRRVFSTPFLQAVARALQQGGALRVVTDDVEYFAAMTQVLEQGPGKLTHSSAADGEELPKSTFEERFRERGLAIYQMMLRKAG